MSFRDNLQHLRSTRNMTQEQLAMLLGVSRQSVTKWESGKSYPEMDKLIKICDIFGCTLDDLVTGDLTNVLPQPEQAVAAGPAADVCGYDEHFRDYASRMSLGVAVLVAGVGVMALLSGLSESLENTGAVLMFACIAAGLALIVPATVQHGEFRRQHPFVEDFYTPTDRMEFSREFGRAMAAGVVACVCSIVPPIALEGTRWEDASAGVFLFIVAGGVWAFVRWGILSSRLDVDAYNREKVEDDRVLTEAEKHHRWVNRMIMVGAVAFFVVLTFIPDTGYRSLDKFLDLVSLLPIFAVLVACSVRNHMAGQEQSPGDADLPTPDADLPTPDAEPLIDDADLPASGE